MDENEIRKIIQDEFNILSQSDLSEDNIIIKNTDITKRDIIAWGVTSLTLIGRVKNFIVLAGKSANKIIKVVVVALGIWEALQFSSALLFEKTLTDAIELAREVRNTVVDYTQAHFNNVGDEREKFIITSDRWQKYTDQQYRKEVYTYLTESRSTDDLLSPDINYLPSSGTPENLVMNASPFPDDFKVV
ncbi:MAG: hypothetical protein KKI12_04385 [Proteobacteria bacterium]|nr:hypothetical protein [Pseudomonadota bacterium]MBU4259642.1 hypothetical protein [Pseudomonadota bacterium]MBU4287393.1 hypothetical protein [Pseudomonadota bacterium]